MTRRDTVVVLVLTVAGILSFALTPIVSVALERETIGGTESVRDGGGSLPR